MPFARPAHAVPWLLAACLAGGCASMASELTMNRAERVQQADAQLELREESNGNTEVAVEVSNLPPAGEFRENATVYVVWVQEPGGGLAHNLGALAVGRSGRGGMESLTPLRKFDIYITAETVAEARAPSGNRALWASVAQE